MRSRRSHWTPSRHTRREKLFCGCTPKSTLDLHMTPLAPPLTPPQRVLMGPGPSEIHPQVLAALGAPTVGHLDPYYLKLMSDMQDMLRSVMRSKNEMTMAISGTGSAGMEAAVVNVV